MEKINKDITKEETLFIASQWQLIRRKFVRHKLAMGAMAILSILYFLAIFAEFTSPYDPRIYDGKKLFCPPQQLHFFDEVGKFYLRPFVYENILTINKETLSEDYFIDKTSKKFLHLFVRGMPYKLWGLFKDDIHLFGLREGKAFLLGTDGLGRDMVSRIIYGGRVSLSIGLVGVAISFVFGIAIGGISGYFGGKIDTVIQRIIEFIISIPTLPLWMGLSLALPPQWTMLQVYFGIVLILSLVGWTGLARVVRGKFMAVKQEDFVMAAIISGVRTPRIIFRHLLPSFYSYIIASLTLSIPGMILGETTLSFIGLGLQPPAISWGVLLSGSQAIRILATKVWLLIPGIFVIIAILAFNFVGDGLRDAADPYAT